MRKTLVGLAVGIALTFCIGATLSWYGAITYDSTTGELVVLKTFTIRVGKEIRYVQTYAEVADAITDAASVKRLVPMVPYSLKASLTIPAGLEYAPLPDAIATTYYSIRSSTYRWVTTGEGVGEYRCELAAGTDPGFGQPASLHINGSVASEGAAGSLAAGEWDHDGTYVVVRLSDDSDPDSQAEGYVEIHFELTISSHFESVGRRLFTALPGEVTFTEQVTLNPKIFAAATGFNGTTDDINAWKCAFAAFPATGGVLDCDGITLWGSGVTWPNDGTTNYPIWLRGNVGSSQTGTFNTVTGGGGGQIKYIGTGTAIDFRNGDGSNLDFSGAITGIRLSGPYTTGDTTPDNETNAATVGLNLYNAKQAKIENVSVIGFGTGIYVANDLYYAKLRDLTISTAKWGMKTYGKWNGTTLENSKISTCGVGGLYAEYYGDNLSLINCWIELCGRYAGNYSSPLTGYGLSARFGQMVTIIGGSHYWESNGDSDGGDAHIRISGDGYYSAILNLYGQHFSYSSKRYIAYLKDATALNVHGCRLLSYQGATAPAYSGYLFQFSGMVSDGTLRGNVLPKIDVDVDAVTKQIHIASQSILSRLDIQDHLHPGITLDRAGDGANYTRVIPLGHVFLNDNPTKTNSGGLVGWQATEPGSGTLANLNGVEPSDVQPDAAEDWSEGTITNGEFTMSVAAGDADGAKEGLIVGRAIQIDTDGAVANGAFVPANFVDAVGATTDYAIIREVATTGEPSTITLDRSLSSATVTGGLIRPNAVERSYIGGRIWYKSVTLVSSSGTGEDDLMVATTLTAAMLKQTSTIPILARGTITGTAGNHTLKIYLGDTAFTILSGTTTAGAWRFQGEIQITAAATQTLSGLFWNADGVAYIETDATKAISGALALKMTGECANAGDTITQSLFVVDLK
jgi:hypothetical protein